jgi:hypothetical protein
MRRSRRPLGCGVTRPSWYSFVFSQMKPSGTNSVKPPVSFWSVRRRTMWRATWTGVSTWPYITVDVVGTPSRWAVVMISIQVRTSTFLCERISRTSSSRISAAVPGMLPRPVSRSMPM